MNTVGLPGISRIAFRSAGQVFTSLLQFKIKSALLGKHFSCLSGLYRFQQLVIRSVRIAPSEIVPDRPFEQYCLLGHYADPVSQIIQRILLDIDPVHQYLSSRCIIEPGDQIHKRTFAGAGGADDTDGFAGTGSKADI